MNFLPKSDSIPKHPETEELDLPTVRLFAVSEKSELNMDDPDEMAVVDGGKTTIPTKLEDADQSIESELDIMLQEQMAAQNGEIDDDGETGEFLSARILKIRDKQVTASELKGQIAEGTSLLRDLASKADLLTRYLDSTEVELTQLESSEKSSEKLANFNRTLSQQYEEAKETLDEQQTLLDFMEAEKTKSRNTIEMARKEIARLLEYKREQAVEMTQAKSVLAKAENDRSVLSEKLETTYRVQKELEAENEARLQRIHQFEVLRKESEKLIAALRTKNDELEEELQRSAVSLSDMRLKHSDANSRVLGLQTQLEEMSHELSGLKREAENNARLKEKRIVELESRLTSIDRPAVHEDYAPKNKPASEKKKVKAPDTAPSLKAVAGSKESAA